MLRISTSIPESFYPKAEYVFRFFSLVWGVPVSVSRSASTIEKPDILYSANPRHKDCGSVFIPFNERLYAAECTCRAIEHNGFTLWSMLGDNPASLDIIASSFRLLTFLDEQRVAVEARDRRGTFHSRALPDARQQTAQLPLVDGHAQYVWQQVTESQSVAFQPPVPKWPGGKKYAVALTHDTDAISLGAPKELATNFSKYIIRRDPTFLSMVTSGLRYIGNPADNPFFGFPLWKEFEIERQLRSCFYLFAKVVRLKRDINNCKSSVVDQRFDWNILKQMVGDGWEFGFHAPIDPDGRVDAFVQGKHWIETNLGAPIYGLRHHYWALDWINPHITFRKHIDAGFRYDTSIAWKDVAGFRAATCHPFRPFDPEWNQSLDIYQLPTCLMDGHVIQNSEDVTSAVQSGHEIIRQVKAHGGMAVLDWHTETACNAFNYQNYLTTLRDILKPLLEDSDVWFATPWEITQHWHARSIKLGAAQITNHWRTIA